MQDTGVSAEGNLAAYPGLRSDPHDHRTGRQQTRSVTTIDQLQTRDPVTRGISAIDRDARRA